MLSSSQPWQPELNWNTPAGRVLDRLVEALPTDHVWRVIVFGSAPLQLAMDPEFLSGDVDVISQEDVSEHCRKAGLLVGQSPICVEPCSVTAFVASPDWQLRACQAQRQHVVFIFPHPVDILVSKVRRLEEKDLRAFKLVIAKTGHPTAEELITALQGVVDIYRPNFDEESMSDPARNTRVLWHELFGKDIDVRQVIIAPALADRQRTYAAAAKGLKHALESLKPPPL